MPRYTYRCPECGITVERHQTLREFEMDAHTPVCGSNHDPVKMETVITPPAHVSVEGGTPRFHRR